MPTNDFITLDFSTYYTQRMEDGIQNYLISISISKLAGLELNRDERKLLDEANTSTTISPKVKALLMLVEKIEEGHKHA